MRAMRPADPLQESVLDGLNAETETVDPTLPHCPQLRKIHRSWICLKTDLRPVLEHEGRSTVIENTTDLRGLKDRRGSAAEENGTHPPVADRFRGGPQIDLPGKPCEVLLRLDRIEPVGVEIAVITARGAVGNVNIQPHRFRVSGFRFRVKGRARTHNSKLETRNCAHRITFPIRSQRGRNRSRSQDQ